MGEKLNQLGSKMVALPEQGALKTFSIVAKMPTTQFRIAVTILMMAATTVKYMLSATWVPSTQWLLFLLGMAGVDTASHIGQRMTDKDYRTSVIAAQQQHNGNGDDAGGDTDLSTRPSPPDIG